MNRFLKMDKADTVATALVNLNRGDSADICSPDNSVLEEVTALENIPFGNKIALLDIHKGVRVIKYGAEIGVTTADIRKGELVHVHNLRSECANIPDAIKEEIMKQMNIKREEGWA